MPVCQRLKGFLTGVLVPPPAGAVGAAAPLFLTTTGVMSTV
jgi:hypothetical protein